MRNEFLAPPKRIDLGYIQVPSEVIDVPAKVRPVLDVIAALVKLPSVPLPLVHRFTPGLYIRELFVPKGTFVVTRKHLTEHPYVVSKGKVEVWLESGDSLILEAPFTGITKPDTRRYCYAHEDTIWTTFHPTTETDPDTIVEQITAQEDFAQYFPESPRERFEPWKETKPCLLQE